MEYNEGKKGWVEVITGPMFAGKTEELIRRVKRMEFAHKNYLIFKPTIDNRYSQSEIVSHNKKSLKAINISHGSDIKRHIKPNTQAIVIDEVPFAYAHITKSIRINVINHNGKFILEQCGSEVTHWWVAEIQ